MNTVTIGDVIGAYRQESNKVVFGTILVVTPQHVIIRELSEYDSRPAPEIVLPKATSVFFVKVTPIANVNLTDIEKQTVEVYKNGNLIDAIKKYRELTGMGLRESKDAVETMLNRLGMR